MAGCLVWSWRELASGAPARLSMTWSHSDQSWSANLWLLSVVPRWFNSSRRREWIHPQQGPHFEQAAINTHRSVCLDSCSQSFESHESALESKITRDQQIDKLYNKGWQKILADNQVSIYPRVREGQGRAQRMSRNWTLGRGSCGANRLLQISQERGLLL